MRFVIPSRASWRKSSYSNHHGDCVEVAVGAGLGGARDSKDPQGGVLVFSATAFHHLVRTLRGCPRTVSSSSSGVMQPAQLARIGNSAEPLDLFANPGQQLPARTPPGFESRIGSC